MLSPPSSRIVMKKQITGILSFLLLVLARGSSQNVAINNDGSPPNVHALLDVKSGTRGILIPRMDSASRKAIPNTKGLLVYDSTTSSFWFNTGIAWQNLSNSTGWTMAGNSGTVDGSQFLGTTDSVALTIRVNNKISGRIDPGSKNVYWGYQIGASNTTGFLNTAIGYKSLSSNTTGITNTAVGGESLLSNTS